MRKTTGFSIEVTRNQQTPNGISAQKVCHPRFVFDSVPFSQLLRTLRNNSKVETQSIELEQCLRDFENRRYNEEELVKLKEKAITKTTNTVGEENTEEELVFPVHYFDKLKDFKAVVHSMNNEFIFLTVAQSGS